MTKKHFVFGSNSKVFHSLQLYNTMRSFNDYLSEHRPNALDEGWGKNMMAAGLMGLGAMGASSGCSGPDCAAQEPKAAKQSTNQREPNIEDETAVSIKGNKFRATGVYYELDGDKEMMITKAVQQAGRNLKDQIGDVKINNYKIANVRWVWGNSKVIVVITGVYVRPDKPRYKYDPTKSWDWNWRQADDMGVFDWWIQKSKLYAEHKL